MIDSEKIVPSSGHPTALEISFGYVIIGQAQGVPAQIWNSRIFLNINRDLNSLVEEMWQIEDFSPSSRPKEDEICENIFSETFTRQFNGKYVVALPFKENPLSIGGSFTLGKNWLVWKNG